MSGYGWAFNAGTSWRARLINFIKKQGETLPLMSFGYLAAIFKSHGHSVEYLTNEVPDSDIAFISSSMVDYRNEIEWAKKVCTVYEKSTKRGKGATVVEGKMIDEVHYKRAKALLKI